MTRPRPRCEGSGEHRTFSPSNGRLPFKANGDYAKAEATCRVCGRRSVCRTSRSSGQLAAVIPTHTTPKD